MPGVGQVGDVDNVFASLDAAQRRSWIRAHITGLPGEFGWHATRRRGVKMVAVIRAQCTARGLALDHCLVQQDIEDRLQVAGRGINHLQYLSDRLLLLQ
jgi:hypothetical protein